MPRPSIGQSHPFPKGAIPTAGSQLWPRNDRVGLAGDVWVPSATVTYDTGAGMVTSTFEVSPRPVTYLDLGSDDYTVTRTGGALPTGYTRFTRFDLYTRANGNPAGGSSSTSSGGGGDGETRTLVLNVAVERTFDRIEIVLVNLADSTVHSILTTYYPLGHPDA